MGKTASLANIGTIADSSLGFRNRLINGGMTIDQRNAGASVTPTTSGTYTLDRWAAYLSQSSKYSVRQNAGSVANGGSVVAPTGFTNWLGATSLSAYSVGSSEFFSLLHIIEGFNASDFGWGAAGAATVTLSFWVRSSLTGTFGGAVQSYAGDANYPFSYTISAANTWEQKTVTIAGPTTGTFPTNNTASIAVGFCLGAGATLSGTAGSWSSTLYRSATGATSVVGTNGATFYITGVQLEKGSTATSFDYRPYGTELALCQRYYFEYPINTLYYGFQNGTTGVLVSTNTPVCLRTTPSLTMAAGSKYCIRQTTTAASTSTTLSSISYLGNNLQFNLDGFTGLSDLLVANLLATKLTVSAEL